MLYFFEFSDLDASGDGLFFQSFDEMRREARRALVRMAEEMDQSVDEYDVSVRVLDGGHRPVYNLCLSIKGNSMPQ